MTEEKLSIDSAEALKCKALECFCPYCGKKKFEISRHRHSYSLVCVSCGENFEMKR